jgi:hypothetical protein
MKNQKKINHSIFLVLTVAGVMLFQNCAVYNNVPPAITVPEIVQMSKDGVDSKDIIKDIKRSRTVYWLKADQLARLRDEGVSDSVINYMEKTHINAVRQNQRLEDSNYWWPGWDGYWYGGPAFGWPYDYWRYNWGPTIIFNGHEGERRFQRGRR